jgi:hypothetical protein
VDTIGCVPIDLAWQPELADYTEAYRARNRARRTRLKLGVLMGVVFLIGAIGALIGSARLIGIGVGGIVAIPVAVFVLQTHALRTIWRKNPALQARVEARIALESGLTSSNGVSTSQIVWSGIDSFLETEHLFVVQLSGYRRLPFLILAKRGLANTRQVDDLRALLAAGTTGSTATAPRP